MEEVKEWIETFEDRENWKQLLLSHSKENLSELIIDRMSKDFSFRREVYLKLVKRQLSVEESIDDYKESVTCEISRKIPDVDYLVLLSSKLLERSENTNSLLEKLYLYVAIITSLDFAIDSGAGFKNEDEYLLFEVMDKSRDFMLHAIENQYHELTAGQLAIVSNFLKKESERYHPIDLENRIETAFKKIDSI